MFPAAKFSFTIKGSSKEKAYPGPAYKFTTFQINKKKKVTADMDVHSKRTLIAFIFFPRAVLSTTPPGTEF